MGNHLYVCRPRQGKWHSSFTLPPSLSLFLSIYLSLVSSSLHSNFPFSIFPSLSLLNLYFPLFFSPSLCRSLSPSRFLSNSFSILPSPLFLSIPFSVSTSLCLSQPLSLSSHSLIISYFFLPTSHVLSLPPFSLSLLSHSLSFCQSPSLPLPRSLSPSYKILSDGVD